MNEHDEEKTTMDLNNYELVGKKPKWVVEVGKEFNDPKLQRIIRFFVIESPCKDVSTLGKPLSTYGWGDKDIKKNGWLEKKILSIMGLEEKKTFFYAQKLVDMASVFSSAAMDERFIENQSQNRIAMLLSDCKVLCIFRHIRNAFAHLRFAIVGDNKDTLVFENGEAYKDRFRVKARMIIKIDTLISVIECIENDKNIMDSENEEKLKKAEEESNRIDNMIITLISTKTVKSVDEMCETLDLKRKIVNRAIGRLNRNTIQ